MTSLFFEDHIQALYMMKEFGVKFYILGEDEKGDEGKFDLDFIGCPLMYQDFIKKDIGKIYVAKESEKIFEAKDGDVVWSWKGHDSFLMYLHSFDEVFWQVSSGKRDTCTSSTEPSKDWIIIERNNKPFFNFRVEDCQP